MELNNRIQVLDSQPLEALSLDNHNKISLLEEAYSGQMQLNLLVVVVFLVLRHNNSNLLLYLEGRTNLLVRALKVAVFLVSKQLKQVEDLSFNHSNSNQLEEVFSVIWLRILKLNLEVSLGVNLHSRINHLLYSEVAKLNQPQLAYLELNNNNPL